MKKNFLLTLVLLVIFAISCGSGPQVKQDVADPNIAIVSAQNGQLAKYPVSGFGYKSSKLSNEQWDQWAKSAAPVVQEVINKIPEEYVLQVTGHTDGSGPEEPVAKKPGNIKISTDRAKTVYDALKRAKITSPKMTYKGVGSDDLLREYDPKAPEQRRVTFKIVPKK